LLAGGLDPARYRPVVALAMDGELRGDLQAAGVEVLVRPLAVLRRAALSPRGLARIGAMLARAAAAWRDWRGRATSRSCTRTRR
jgi:hypothetical protein